MSVTSSLKFEEEKHDFIEAADYVVEKNPGPQEDGLESDLVEPK